MKLNTILNQFSVVFLTTGFTTDFANCKWIFRKSSHPHFLAPDDVLGKDVKDSWPREKLDSAENVLTMKMKHRNQETTYVGAVLEYEPYDKWTEKEKGYGVLRRNAKTLVEFATLAKTKYGVDIMVIPEYALTSLDVSADDVQKFLTYTLYVPEPVEEFVPCYISDEDSDHLEALKILSCAALENKMYLVINVAELHPCSPDTVMMAPWPVKPSKDCPQVGYTFYNCEVVLDRKGAVIAKYRKQHLYMEDMFTPGPMNDKSALFLTDFNVLFSLQICFDIVFEHPSHHNVKYMGIKDVAMSTAWVDYLPFEIADVVQNGWSRSLQTNLLVAGHHKPELGKLGSGIYKGYSEQLPVYTYDKDSGNVLVVSNVTTIKATELMPKLLRQEVNASLRQKFQTSKKATPEILPYHTKETKRRHLIVHENLQNYTKIWLKKGRHGEIMNVSACSNDNFCCNISYQYSGDLIYMFLVFSGQFGVGSGRYVLGKQICGIIFCETVDYNTCAYPELGLQKSDSFGPFTITSSTFKTEAISLVGIHRDLSLIRGDHLPWQREGFSATLSSSEHIPNLLVSALYGRWYCEDNI